MIVSNPMGQTETQQPDGGVPPASTPTPASPEKPKVAPKPAIAPKPAGLSPVHKPATTATPTATTATEASKYLEKSYTAGIIEYCFLASKQAYNAFWEYKK